MTGGGRVFLTLLLINLSLPLDGLANLPLQFIMKDQLEAGPVTIAASAAIISSPIILAWLAGFLRDRRSEGGIDRLFLASGILLAACCYAFLAANAPSVRLLVIVAVVASAALILAKTSVQAVMAQLAQDTHTENRVGALWNIVEALPTIVSYGLGPWLLHSLGPQYFFMVCSALAIVGLPVGLAAMDRTKLRSPTARPPVTLRTLRQLFVYPTYVRALLVIFLFTFSPGWQTPILFYLTKVVGLSQLEYGRFWLFISLFTVIGCGLYGVWAKSASERSLLRAATWLMILQSPLLPFIHSSTEAYLVGAASGVMYGFGIAAYWSLLIRSIPSNLHGTAYMVAVLVSTLGVRGGDIVGSWMFEEYGYILPFATSTVCTVLIAPVLFSRRFVANSER